MIIVINIKGVSRAALSKRTTMALITAQPLWSSFTDCHPCHPTRSRASRHTYLVHKLVYDAHPTLCDNESGAHRVNARLLMGAGRARLSVCRFIDHPLIPKATLKTKISDRMYEHCSWRPHDPPTAFPRMPQKY